MDPAKQHPTRGWQFSLPQLFNRRDRTGADTVVSVDPREEEGANCLLSRHFARIAQRSFADVERGFDRRSAAEAMVTSLATDE